MFTGCGTALVTPFRRDQSLDEETLRRLVRRQIDAGINFLVPCGTTGENPTITLEEHIRAVEITVDEAKKDNIPVLAGAGGYYTEEVIDLSKRVEAAGANGILSVTPYYNKPTPEGLYQHFKAIAASVHVPIILYSVQGRTGVNIDPATLKRLAEIDNVIGVKEASGNIGQIARILSEMPDSFTVLSGDDALTLPIIALGGRGLISVASNEIPAEMSQFVDTCRRGDLAAARAFMRKYLPLLEVNFIESNPMPVKAAMALMGLLEPVWRLPMVAPTHESLAKIEKVLAGLGLAGTAAELERLSRGVTGANQ